MLASALDRDTRGFISMTTISPLSGFEAELDVRPAGLDPDAPDARERGVAHALVLDVGEGLDRRDRDRVAGVHAHRVEVLDPADDDHVVGAVAHHLELVLLPPEHRLLEQDLADRARVEASDHEVAELVLVVGEAGATAAEDERRTADQREAHLDADPHRPPRRV